MKYGDRFEIQAFNQTYVYEVRSSERILEKEVHRMLKHEEKDWVTLITCEGYNTETEDYRYRRMVRAILVDKN